MTNNQSTTRTRARQLSFLTKNRRKAPAGLSRNAKVRALEMSAYENIADGGLVPEMMTNVDISDGSKW